MLGLSMQVYGRYERAFSKLHVTRMIHLCEILGFMPMECCSVLPRIYGAARRRKRATPWNSRNRSWLCRTTPSAIYWPWLRKWSPWSAPQTERRRKRKKEKKDVFRRLALR
ncbi:hypothetical protein MES4922_20331 [Mesorhizobium ventifaucium]|uniref:XRE family transcriptional regulator n=1 Tax=Mesorhizobium ventifaucium TaxID=666020 RepID=A0ABM9DQD9_9HYPH|nr:hypothetical protein MES4922_20331 [Mesorhizobium ventifaucium]